VTREAPTTSVASPGAETLGGSQSERETRIAALAAHVRRELKRHGLEWEDVPQALRYQSLRAGVPNAAYERMLRAAEAVVRDERLPDDLDGFRELVHEVESLLSVEIDASALDRPLKQALRPVPEIFAVALFAVTIYLVIGGLASGQSELAKGNGLLALALFAFLLVLLGAVEALHISVTLLRLKDLNAIRDEFPRTFRAHEIFRYERGTEWFLAGRQFLVIGLVFFAAYLTSFAHMTHYPGTHRTIYYPFWWLFLKHGIAGALGVLWFAQLTPQFYANRRPIHLMNTWAISKLFYVALFMESIGVTKPGGWFVSKVPQERAIPVSAVERYRQAVEEITGTGVVGVKKVWRISERAAATLSCDVSYRFARSGVPATHDESITVAGSVSGLKGDARLLADDGTAKELHAPGPILERKDDGLASISRSAEPKHGSFQKGDVLMLHTELEFARAAGLDRVSITEPTQYLLIRVELRGDPETIGGARVQGYKIGDAPTADVMVGKRPILDQDLELMRSEDGTPCFEFTLTYPEANTHYFMAWEADYAMT